MGKKNEVIIDGLLTTYIASHGLNVMICIHPHCTNQFTSITTKAYIKVDNWNHILQKAVHDHITRVATGVLCVIQVTVDCFLKNMIPVIYLDACFCSNRGKLICAMWIDANHHIQPMACYVCGEETINDYLILLTHLMEKGLKRIEKI